MKISFHHLQDRAVLQTRSVHKDGQGGFQETWSDLKQIWIKLVPKSYLLKRQSEYLRALRRGSLENSNLEAQVMMRNFPVIEVGMRLVHKNQIYVVSNQPRLEKGYQFFEVSRVCLSDGDS